MEARAFKNWREGFKLTQEEVAQRFRVSRTTVQNWESGATPVSELVDMTCELWGNRLRQEDPSRGPVTLIYTDAPMFVDPYAPRRPLAMMQQEPFPSNAAAIARVQKLSRGDRFCNPFIMEKDGRSLWNSVELRRVVDGEDSGAPTLHNLLMRIAKEVKASSGSAVWPAKLPTSSEKQERVQRIEALATELEAMASKTFDETGKARKVEEIFSQLLHLGTRAPDQLVSAVADAFVVLERV
jgi:DNA-binding XRE family transcriptional regulator